MKSVSPETLLVLSVAIALVPLLISVGTCYLKFSIVLGILRSGFGTQQAPSASLIMALSLVMSLVVMEPVVTETASHLSRVQAGTLAGRPISALLDELQASFAPWRAFLEQHCGERERAAFRGLARRQGATVEGAPAPDSLATVLAAFVVTEVKGGFLTAFLLLLPFFVIDMVVANLLVGLGLTMVSPVVVSLPLKLLLFISSDGWLLLAQSLIRSYR